MNKKDNIKEQIYKHLHALLDEKIDVYQKAINSAIESRDNDTKSSVGDKYETGRAMMHLELEKSEYQLNHNLKLKNDLSRINLRTASKRVEYGSLIVTDRGSYFISIGIGKIVIDNSIVYAISLNSPLGAQLKGKKAGDILQFNGREFHIREVI